MIPQVRKVSSIHITHRQDTLEAISKKAHSINARVEFLHHEAERLNSLLQNVPEDVGSRLDWLNRQLSGNAY